MAKNDPILSVLTPLDDNWENANTSISYDPQIHSGWHNDETSQPQITVSNADESAIGGVNTAFSGIDPTGAGPTQEFIGLVMVNCWSDREVEPNVNPKKLTYEFSEEVKRIVKLKTLTATDLRHIAVRSRRFIPDTTAEPTTFRYELEIEYSYRDST